MDSALRVHSARWTVVREEVSAAMSLFGVSRTGREKVTCIPTVTPTCHASLVNIVNKRKKENFVGLSKCQV